MQSRKNILLISLDDAVAPWPYRHAFSEALRIPNLDRICAKATTFRSTYCQAPVCGPSRASFMSGRAPHQLGVFENKDKVFERISARDMWPFLLKASGYFASSGGKVHHGFKPLPHKHHFLLYSDRPKHFRIDWKLPNHKASKQFGGRRRGLATTDPADDGYYHDAHASDSFVDFIENYDAPQPFYREVGFYGPHGPFITPARYKEMYDVRAFQRPTSWASGYDPMPFERHMMGETFLREDLEWWQDSVRNYFSAYSHVDHHLGRVWDALQASKHADNTIVIVLSDHGMHIGDKKRFGKRSLWEQVAAVPLVIFVPDRPVARTIDDPVALLDVGPTVLDYAGITCPDACIGRSLRPVMDGAASDPDRAVPTFYFDSVGVRKGKYRLIRYENGATQFYDLDEDWWQLKNLGQSHPAFAPMYQALIETSVEHGLDLARAA